MIRILSLIDSGRLGLGLAALALCNLVLFVSAESVFAWRHPESFAEDWPTVSRALSDGSLPVFPLLAAAAGLGLFLGGLGVARMYALRARRAGLPPLVGATLVANGLLAALMGVVHYFHVTVTLAVSDRGHMLLSYTFFFGMTGMILLDFAMLSAIGERLYGVAAGSQEPLARTLRLALLLGWCMLLAALAFLVFYLLKDWEVLAEGTRDVMRRIFVVTELVWIVLAHAYALTHMVFQRLHGAQFRHGPGSPPTALGGAATGVPT